MATLNPYLLFDGHCHDAFNFYKAAFEAEFNSISFYKDMPGNKPVPAEEAHKIMHVSLPINDKVCLMGADVSPLLGSRADHSSRVNVSVECDSSEEAHHLYDLLSAEGEIIAPLEKQFWGALHGVFVDKFGITWMINYK